jgi:hypothetical protein
MTQAPFCKKNSFFLVFNTSRAQRHFRICVRIRSTKLNHCISQVWARKAFWRSFSKVAGDKGISETKSKQQSPCSNCMHQPVMSWGNPCSTCLSGVYIGLRCHRLMHALTAWDLKFQVCLRYTFTPATLFFFSLLTIDIKSLQNRLLKVCYAPATSAGLPRLLFFAVAINST